MTKATRLWIHFSPDGKEIYYVRSLGRDEVWAVPTLGGSPRRGGICYFMWFLRRMAPPFFMRSLRAPEFFVRENPD